MWRKEFGKLSTRSHVAARPTMTQSDMTIEVELIQKNIQIYMEDIIDNL